MNSGSAGGDSTANKELAANFLRQNIGIAKQKIQQIEDSGISLSEIDHSEMGAANDRLTEISDTLNDDNVPIDTYVTLGQEVIDITNELITRYPENTTTTSKPANLESNAADPQKFRQTFKSRLGMGPTSYTPTQFNSGFFTGKVANDNINGTRYTVTLVADENNTVYIERVDKGDENVKVSGINATSFTDGVGGADGAGVIMVNGTPLRKTMKNIMSKVNLVATSPVVGGRRMIRKTGKRNRTKK